MFQLHKVINTTTVWTARVTTSITWTIIRVLDTDRGASTVVSIMYTYVHVYTCIYLYVIGTCVICTQELHTCNNYYDWLANAYPSHSTQQVFKFVLSLPLSKWQIRNIHSFFPVSGWCFISLRVNICNFVDQLGVGGTNKVFWASTYQKQKKTVSHSNTTLITCTEGQIRRTTNQAQRENLKADQQQPEHTEHKPTMTHN